MITIYFTRIPVCSGEAKVQLIAHIKLQPAGVLRQDDVAPATAAAIPTDELRAQRGDLAAQRFHGLSRYLGRWLLDSSRTGLEDIFGAGSRPDSCPWLI